MKAIFQKETNSILVLDSFQQKSWLKLQAGAKWMPEYKGWLIPMSVELVEDLIKMNCTLAQEIQLAYYDKKKCLDQANLQKFNEKVIPKEPMPIKAKAYDHQIRGYNIACEIMDLFN